MKKVTANIGQQLIDEIISAHYDAGDLAKRHGLRPEALAAWIGDPANQRVLSGLCVLADLQTQVLLSRYRLAAAMRLINFVDFGNKNEAPQGKDGSPAEPTKPPTLDELDFARRACVDLLKLELKRADVAPVGAEEKDDLNPEALRAMLYGERAKE